MQIADWVKKNNGFTKKSLDSKLYIRYYSWRASQTGEVPANCNHTILLRSSFRESMATNMSPNDASPEGSGKDSDLEVRTVLKFACLALCIFTMFTYK